MNTEVIMMTPNGSYVKGLTSSSINFYVRGAPLKFKKKRKMKQMIHKL